MITNQQEKHYIYLYPNGKDLFGVLNEMIGYDYEPAPLNDVIKQKWCEENDNGIIFVLKEGSYLYDNGKFTPHYE